MAKKKIFPKNTLNSGYLFSSVTVANNGLSVFTKKLGLVSCDIQRMLYNIILNDRKGLEIIPEQE